MTITLIIPPGTGGVRDFTDKLAEKLSAMGDVRVFAWHHDAADEIVEQFVISDCVYLQYSGYGYAKRGAPGWLLKQLQSRRSQIKTLGVFFHELYAFGPPWSSAFWLSPAQRHIARSLAELSDFWLTNREDSAQWLRRFAAEKPHAVLPVFSNVGEMPSYSAARKPSVVVFGGAPLRQKTYCAAGDKLFSWAKRQGLTIHDVGPAIKDPIMADRLTSEGVRRYGRLSEADISSLLTDAMFGVVAYSVAYVAKSGVFAAYCAHGVCPVLVSPHYSIVDGLVPKQHYMAGVPNNGFGPSDAEVLGQAAWNWYQPHCLEKHIARLNSFNI